jgi:hypothetical protein
VANAKTRGDALSQAKKSAVTDALKRTLRLFGDGLGNCVSQNKKRALLDAQHGGKQQSASGAKRLVCGSARRGGGRRKLRPVVCVVGLCGCDLEQFLDLVAV